MTKQEFSKEFQRLHIQKYAMYVNIASAARAVVPALLDAGRTHSAKELQELLFQLDALSQEFASLVSSDPMGAIEYLDDEMKKSGI